MNPLELLLQDDLNHLVDRIAATTQEGTATDCLAQDAALASRLSDAEGRLSAARLGLLDWYVAWRQALQECGDLWALAELRTEPVTGREQRAA